MMYEVNLDCFRISLLFSLPLFTFRQQKIEWLNCDVRERWEGIKREKKGMYGTYQRKNHSSIFLFHSRREERWFPFRFMLPPFDPSDASSSTPDVSFSPYVKCLNGGKISNRYVGICLWIPLMMVMIFKMLLWCFGVGENEMKKRSLEMMITSKNPFPSPVSIGKDIHRIKLHVLLFSHYLMRR